MDIDTIRTRLSSPLNPILQTNGWRPAAVLLIIYENDNKPYIIMTEKSEHMRIHAGEISFPGGKPESGDADLCCTALRETREEVGLDVGRQNVIGQLKSVRTLNSKFMILPFVATLHHVPKLYPNDEVEHILRIPLEPFLDSMVPDTVHGPDMFNLYYNDKVVWGASARILYHVRQAMI